MPARPMTLTAKILHAHAVGLERRWVEAGDLLRVEVDWTLASELAWNGMDRTYERLGRPPLHDPSRFYLAVDHTVDPETLASDPRTRRLVALSRAFAAEAGLEHFYGANETILHTTFYRDLVCPGQIVVGADSHTSSHGGLGAFAIGLGGADVTAAMVLGQTWIEVPQAISVAYRGELPFGLSGKDVILATLAQLGRNAAALERSVEYIGDVGQLTSDMRFAICNMTAELGGLNGIFAADAVAEELLARRRRRGSAHVAGCSLSADEDAPYVERHTVSLRQLAPQVARPHSPDNVCAVGEISGLALDGVFIGACTTTEEELVLAALVLEQQLAAGHEPRAGGGRLVVPGNLEIAENLRSAGLLAAYQRAGFAVGAPGCSMCLGIASARAAPGEVWLSSQNRNFEHRMGRGSIAYLAAASTVAASALTLRVSDPRPWLQRIDGARYERLLGRDGAESPAVGEAPPADDGPSPAAPPGGRSPRGALAGGEGAGGARGVTILERPICGTVQLFGDNVDTDAIIPGEFCHLTDLEQLGRVCFHHVRPGFAQRVAEGATIVVAGHGWGTGSSREHAVWALRGAGVRLVIARSFAFIHRRNLINEAVPHLVLDEERFYLLVAEGAALRVDPSTGEVELVGSDERFQAQPMPQVARRIIAAGGLVAAIRHRGSAAFG